MSNTPKPADDRLLDLLAERAVLGLSAEDAAELERLLAASPDVDPDELDRLAAELTLSSVPVSPEPLPAELRERILASAALHLPPRATPAFDSSFPRVPRLVWLALAASVVLVIGGWWWMTRPKPVRGPAELRQELLVRAGQPGSGVIRVEWTATKDPAAHGATGDVVWSAETQEGYMRFKGLAPNSPDREQYQLWVFDAARDERYPVDGGVFNVGPDAGEVIVPIHAKLRVAQPTLFAVTIEPPGGVVVSSRERLPLIAKVPESGNKSSQN